MKRILKPQHRDIKNSLNANGRRVDRLGNAAEATTGPCLDQLGNAASTLHVATQHNSGLPLEPPPPSEPGSLRTPHFRPCSPVSPPAPSFPAVRGCCSFTWLGTNILPFFSEKTTLPYIFEKKRCSNLCIVG